MNISNIGFLLKEILFQKNSKPLVKQREIIHQSHTCQKGQGVWFLNKLVLSIFLLLDDHEPHHHSHSVLHSKDTLLTMTVRRRLSLSKQCSYSGAKRMAKASHCAALYRATAVAYSSVSAKSKNMPFCVKDIVKSSKQLLALEEGLLSCKVAFLKAVDSLKACEKTQLVFGLIDTKHLNRIGEAELEDALTRLKKNSPPNSSSIPSAKSLIEIFATTTSNDLTQDEFESVIEGLAASSIDCSFDDMCHLLLISLLFSDSGVHVMQEVVNSVAGKSSCDREEAMCEARLMILFDAMDEEQEGYVYLKDLIKSFYRLTEDMGNLEQESIFMLREKSLRRLDYELFCEVLSSVLEGIHRTVDDVADELTVSISSGSIGDEEIKHLLLSDSFVMPESASSSATEDGKEIQEYGQEKSDASWSSGLGFPRIHAKSA